MPLLNKSRSSEETKKENSDLNPLIEQSKTAYTSHSLNASNESKYISKADLYAFETEIYELKEGTSDPISFKPGSDDIFLSTRLDWLRLNIISRFYCMYITERCPDNMNFVNEYFPTNLFQNPDGNVLFKNFIVLDRIIFVLSPSIYLSNPETESEISEDEREILNDTLSYTLIYPLFDKRDWVNHAMDYVRKPIKDDLKLDFKLKIPVFSQLICGAYKIVQGSLEIVNKLESGLDFEIYNLEGVTRDN
jgi:hypothetical protein